MKIYVINLKKDISQRQRIISMFQQLNITNYEIFDAVNGNELKHFEINKEWYDPWSHLHLTKGEVGCALSHYQLWQKIKKEKKMAMILEDDFIIDNEKQFVECANYEEEYTKKVCSKFEVLYLGRKKMSQDTEQNFTILPSEKSKSPLLKTILEQSQIVNAKFSYWCIGYILTPIGAHTLTTNYDFSKNIFPVDEYIPWMYGQNDLTYVFGSYCHTPQANKYLAIEPSIIKPKNNAFADSNTYFSTPVPVYNTECDLITVATDENDCVKRYRKSCLKYGFDPVILGLDDAWNGGDMSAGQGGGQKVNFLKRYLQDISTNKLIIFTDSYDVICNNHVQFILKKYKENFSGKIVFGAETSCWPDKNLAERYPIVDVKNKFLNSGNFMGWSDDIKKIIEKPIQNSDDDQLYYTHRLFESLNGTIDTKIVLDYNNELFFCLNGETNNYALEKNKSCLTVRDKRPTFIHGNGPPAIKRELNYIGNYTTEGYNSTYGYKVNPLKNSPKILIVYDELHNPSEEFVSGLINLDYSSELITLLYLFKNKPNSKVYSKFNKNVICVKKNNSLTEIMEFVKSNDAEHVFYITSYATITNPKVLKCLLSEKKDIICPILVKPNELYSNFWGDIGPTNFYKRSKNYIDIVNYKEKGCWNVSYVWYCCLIKRTLFNEDNFLKNLEKGTGEDMAFCYNMRKQNKFMYVLNTEYFGYYSEESDITDLNSYKINEKAWEEKYIDSSFRDNMDVFEVVCPDVHKIKMFTPRFCEELIKAAEENDSWSKGGNKHYDKRLRNTENHPTQDVHLNQIGLEDMWKFALKKYISPLIWNIYKYSYKDINISFIVKYSMDGQKELRPHHDSSAFTTSICLNDDFEGGGCHFIRQDKKVINKDIGSVIIHPGRLTHYHQGLPITKGTRYIMVSFNN
jgi:GR25 family glycosyltransferase involved in LPS biosynthesis